MKIERNPEGICVGGPDDGTLLVATKVAVEVYRGRRQIDGQPNCVGVYWWNGLSWDWHPSSAVAA